VEGLVTQKRTVRQALQFVADYPTPVTDDNLVMQTHELIARTLFDIANKPNVQERGSMARANRARKMIFDRLAGKRRAGTRPMRPNGAHLTIRDLTGKEITPDVD
jgi:hypothetical protein